MRGPHISLRFVRNTRQQKYRAAVVVSRKVSKSAVVRNRIRRRIFELVRRESSQLAQPYDLVFSVQSEALATANPEVLAQTIKRLLSQARVLKTTSSTTSSHAIVENTGS